MIKGIFKGLNVLLMIFSASALSSHIAFAQQTKKQVQKESPEKRTVSSVEKKQVDKESIEWGEWGVAAKKKNPYGVGIQGSIESQLSQLDKSNLLDNADGVASKKTNTEKKHVTQKKTRDIKRMMRELEIMEAEVKKEINDETEF